MFEIDRMNIKLHLWYIDQVPEMYFGVIGQIKVKWSKITKKKNMT